MIIGGMNPGLYQEYMNRLPALLTEAGAYGDYSVLDEVLRSYINQSWRSDVYKKVNIMGKLKKFYSVASKLKDDLFARAPKVEMIRNTEKFDEQLLVLLEMAKRCNNTAMPKDHDVPSYIDDEGVDHKGRLDNLDDANWDFKNEIYQFKYDMIERILQVYTPRKDSRFKVYLGTDAKSRKSDHWEVGPDGRKLHRVLAFELPSGMFTFDDDGKPKTRIEFHLPVPLADFVDNNYRVRYYDVLAKSFQPEENPNVEISNWNAKVLRPSEEDLRKKKFMEEYDKKERHMEDVENAIVRGVKSGTVIPVFPAPEDSKPIKGMPAEYSKMDVYAPCVVRIKSRGRYKFNAIPDAFRKKAAMVRDGKDKPMLFDDWELYSDVIVLKSDMEFVFVYRDGHVER